MHRVSGTAWHDCRTRVYYRTHVYQVCGAGAGADADQAGELQSAHTTLKTRRLESGPCPWDPGLKLFWWADGWAGGRDRRLAATRISKVAEWFTAEKGFVYQPKIIPQRDTGANRTRPQIRAACVPRDERHAARVPRAHRQAAYALRTCALRTAQESLFIHNANSHTTHTAREVVVKVVPVTSWGDSMLGALPLGECAVSNADCSTVLGGVHSQGHQPTGRGRLLVSR